MITYRVYNTQEEAETAQRQKHYQLMLSQYNQFIDTYSEKYQTTITPEFIQQLYQAPKVFLDCTLDECWTYGYNRVLGFRNGEVQTDFEGVTTDWDIPRELQDGRWAITDDPQIQGGSVETDPTFV